MTRRWGRLAAGGLAALIPTLFVTPSIAQDAVDVNIVQADLEDDGTTRVTVAVTGTGVTGEVPADAFTVTEAGEAVDGVDVSPVEQAEEPDPRAVVMLLDASGSTEGDPINQAKAAAVDFAGTVIDASVDVGVVTFADTAVLVQEPTADLAAVTDAINSVDAAGETAFFDAVLVAARTLRNVEGQHSIVAFTDGADTVSEGDLTAAINAAGTVDATVSAVALGSDELDLPALQQLTSGTGGSLVQVANAVDLQGAFEQVAASLTSQYVLTYTSQQATGEFDLGVAVSLDGATYTDEISLLSPRSGPALGQPQVIAVDDPGIFTNQTVLMAALGVLFVAILIVVGFVIVPTGDQRVARTLERGLRVYRRGDGADKRESRAPTAIGQRAVSLVDSLPKPEGYDDRMQLALDRASWPLRSSEFTTLRGLAVLVGVLVGWGLFGNLFLGVAIGVIGWIVPRIILDSRVRARQERFLGQLPDTLQLLSGSLKAGYGILQAIDTVVKETAEPTASEFQRVLTEARLGLPLEEALDGMADRIGSDDLRWVTVAINIQRRVGGNLAELLETVSETLREREMVRRQISVLSAEGRLSAVVLTILPLALGLYILIVNPDYIGTLFEETIGRIMLVGAGILMILGVLWMRKLIDIDV